MKFQDVVYFGYDHGAEGAQSFQLQKEFMGEIVLRFPNVELKDAYDSIKGYRQEVHLDESEADNYYSWLLGKQWYECSLMLQIVMLSKGEEQKAEFQKYFSLAKQQYPESFKKEVL